MSDFDNLELTDDADTDVASLQDDGTDSFSNEMTTWSDAYFAERQRVHNMQRCLCLMRHAARCRNDACPLPRPYSLHCASAKELWNHIKVCENPSCGVPHCLGSRYCLSHFERCDDVNCAACKPVREMISEENRQRDGLETQKLASNTGRERATTITGSDEGVDTKRKRNKKKRKEVKVHVGKIKFIGEGEVFTDGALDPRYGVAFKLD